MEDKIRKVFFQALVEHKIVILRLPTPVAQAAPKNRIEPVLSQFQPIVNKPQRKWDDENEQFIDIEPNWIQLDLRSHPSHPYTVINPDNGKIIDSGRLDSNGFVDIDLSLGIDKVHIYMGEYRAWEKEKLQKVNTQSYDVTNKFLNSLYEYAKLAPELTQEQHQILVDNINHLHDPIKFPDAPKAQVKSSSATEVAYRYLVTYISALKSLGFIYPIIEMGQVSRNNMTGVITPPDFFKPHYYNLNHFLRQHYWVTIPDKEHRETFLDDGEADNRLKQALEELKLGAMTDVFYHSIRSLNYASILPFFKHVQTRARYDLKLKPLEVEQTEAKQRNWIELQFEPDALFCLSKASEGYELNGELDNKGFARIEIPLALSHLTEFDIAYTFKELPWYKKYHARILGGIQLIGGVGSIIGAAAISPTGIGTALSVGIAVAGMDNMIAGYTALVNNQSTRTLGEDALIFVGVPEPIAGMTYGALELGGVATAIRLAVKNGTMKTVQITLSQTVKGQIDELGLSGAKVNQRHVLSLDELKVGRAKGTLDALEENGRLGGALYPEKQLAQLDRYLSRRGISLKVGDEFLPPGMAGGYSSTDRVLMLRSNPTKYEVWHELLHMHQNKLLGNSAYLAQNRVMKEQYVFDKLESMPRRWNILQPEEWSHARWYIDNVGGLW